MRKFFTWRWILSHLFVASMVVLMTNFGFWQLRRLDERRASNDDIRGALAQPATDLAELLDGELLAGEHPAGELLGGETDLDHTPATASGEYDRDNEALIANRTFESSAGSWIVTPLILDDGRVVAVVRGWVPRLWVAGNDQREASAPAGRVMIEGLVFESVEGGRLAGSTARGMPELSRLDLDRLSEATGISFEPIYLRLQTQSPAQELLPVPVPTRELNEGSHMSYAAQWFFFSSGTVVVYYLILRRKHQEAALAA